MVEERHPLKQGLKLDGGVEKDGFFVVEERHPLKQGLKLWFCSTFFSPLKVEERHPLKQGLKPISNPVRYISSCSS